MYEQGTLHFGNRPTLQQQFEVFDRRHPEVWALFRDFAVELLSAGLVRYSADAILHRVRWHCDVEGGKGRDGFKINNNWVSRYARKLADEDPRFAEFFQFRTLMRA